MIALLAGTRDFYLLPWLILVRVLLYKPFYFGVLFSQVLLSHGDSTQFVFIPHYIVYLR